MINTKVIQTPKGRLLVVGGLPEPEAYSYDIHNEEGMPTSVLVWVDDLHCYPLIIDDLPLDSNYELLGKLPDITEEQAKEVVQKVPLCYWMDYLYPRGSLKLTAKESLISLIESEVPLKNRFGEYPPKEGSEGRVYGMGYRYMMDEWMDEEETIFKNPVLFWEPQSKKP